MLRLFEVFTDPKHFQSHSDTILPSIWIRLVRKGFFKSLRILCDSRIPESIEEYQGKAPTPMAEILFQLIMRPLNVLVLADEKDR